MEHEADETPGARKLSFNEAYLQWRNRTRRFKRDSILAGALYTLRQKQPDKLLELRNAPWQTCLLVKWVCQDRMLDHNTGPGISPQELDNLRQLLWELPDKVDFTLGPDMPAQLFFRQVMRAQGGFQRRFTRGFVREAAVLLRLASDAPLRVLFSDRTRLNLQTFVDLSMITFVMAKGGHLTLAADWMKDLVPDYTSESLAAFVALTARDIKGLLTYFRSLPHASAKKMSELQEFPALARFPFLAIDGRLECWHLQVLYRSIEGMVHAVLSEAGQEYASKLGHAFESHVIADVHSLAAPFHDEKQLKAWLPQESEVPDGLLSFPSCNVFVEAKAGLFDESVMTVASAEIFKHKTRALQKAVRQAWAASTGLRKNAAVPPQVLEASSDYLLVVTNKELSAGNGTVLEKVYPAGTLAATSADAARFLPLQNIYVLSIEDFERLVAAVRAGTVDLPSFLADCAARDGDPATSVFYFEQHLDREKVPLGFSAAVESTYSATEQRVRAVVERLERARKSGASPAAGP